MSVACVDKTGPLTDDALVHNGALVNSAAPVAADGAPLRRGSPEEAGRPSSFSPWLLTQLLPQLLIFTGVEVYALYQLSVQSFYSRYATDDPVPSTYSYEATTLQNVVLAQLMIASVVSTIGEPNRLEWYNNYAHLVILALLTGWFIYQRYSGTSSFAEDTLNLEPVPAYFGGYIIAIAVLGTDLSFAAWAVADRCCRSPRKRRQLAILAASTSLLS